MPVPSRSKRLPVALLVALAAIAPHAARASVEETADIAARLASAVSARLGDRLATLRDPDRVEMSGVDLTLRLGTVEADAPADPFRADAPAPPLASIYLPHDLLARGPPSHTLEIKRTLRAKETLDLWSAGSADLGRSGDGMLAAGRSTAGLSAGFDLQPRADRSIGLSLGFDQGLGAVGAVAVPSLSAYGGFHPTPRTYLDAVAGTARVETGREAEDGAALAALGLSGETMAFGALTFGYEARGGGWLLSPYGRAELSAVGSPRGSRTVGARRLSAVTGLRAEYAAKAGGVTLRPGLRFEMLRDLARVGQAAQPLARSSARRFSLGPSLRAEFAPDWTARLESRTLWGAASTERSVELRIEGTF